MSENRELQFFLRLLWDVSNEYTMPEEASRQMIRNVIKTVLNLVI